MAFTSSNFIPLSASANSNAQKVFQYAEAETLVNLRAANYFNDAVSYSLKTGDVLLLIGSDGIGFSQATVDGSGNVTLAENITSA